ncbi:FAD-dependent oxidoreductase [Sphingomicrobium sediminis]|uniref:FAD-dependent oxidoreductase n=1 Tax=Sphingomicrobium sediminis TaxID=2950949 RepID=A0A9X2ELT2_9SPHN|nr:FAD-dependent oxidoreductase [Sphingomicrobium sediminis]MCM8557824.1 FAD-dependent oxidoreductase [Sphingomicrobium sediminis]
MRHFAIVGSGPAGFYTAEALAKAYGENARIDIIDKLPVPYGLIRFGVAPDHQSIKKVSVRYDKVAEGAHVRFVGNVAVGDAVEVDELRDMYDAVVMATGAPHDRQLGIPGEDLPGVMGSAAFVGWYNGHPDFAELDPPLDTKSAVVIGAGNVALDVARILSKTEDEFEGSDIVGHALQELLRSDIETITILARRGPHQVAMTPKELGELGHLHAAAPIVDPADFPPESADEGLEDRGLAKSVGLLRGYAAETWDKPKRIIFDFFARPVRVEGDGKAQSVRVERTHIDKDGRARGTGEKYDVPAGLVVSCIGYSSPHIPGVPYDHRRGRYLNEDGRIDDGFFAVGWARRGPTGTIGTNRPDGYEVAGQIEEAMPPGSDGGKKGGAALDDLLDHRDVAATSFTDWRKIEAAETAAAREGSPREKFVAVQDMLDLLDD